MKVANLETPSIHNVGPKPKATLLSWTPKPLYTMWYAWEFCKDKDFSSKYGAPLPLGWKIVDAGSRKEPTREELVSFFRKAIIDWMPISEFVHFTFVCENIPRALMDQMTRHRLWSFFVQSMRVADVGSTFATDDAYFTPDAIAADPDTLGNYNATMHVAQTRYRQLRSAGVPIEDARGVLPLHTNTKMIVGFNLRAFQQAVEKRTCWILQQQYWAPLLVSMRQELVDKVDPELAFIFAPPCELRGKCITAIEQEYRLAGKDPNPPCPKYDPKRGGSVS